MAIRNNITILFAAAAIIGVITFAVYEFAQVRTSDLKNIERLMCSRANANRQAINVNKSILRQFLTDARDSRLRSARIEEDHGNTDAAEADRLTAAHYAALLDETAPIPLLNC